MHIILGSPPCSLLFDKHLKGPTYFLPHWWSPFIFLLWSGAHRLHSTIFLCFSVLSHHLLDATHFLWLISVLLQFPQFLSSSFYLCFSSLFFVHLEVRSGEFYYPSAYSVLFLDRSLYFITVLVPPVCSGIFHLRANLLTALRHTFSNFNGLPEERKLYPVFFTSNVKMKHWTNFQTENQLQFHNMSDLYQKVLGPL